MEPQVCVPTPFTGDKNMNFSQGTSIYSDVDHEVSLTQPEGTVLPDAIAAETSPGSHRQAEVPTVTTTAAFNFNHIQLIHLQC